MNRPIKFRAWDSKYGHYANTREDDDYTLTWGNADCIHVVKDGTPDFEGRFVLQQWTGLTDKNGKEAWEDDIARVSYYEKGKLREYVAEIRYVETEAGFCFFSEKGGVVGTSRLYLGHNALPWEVIGNIRENPELLTK